MYYFKPFWFNCSLKPLTYSYMWTPYNMWNAHHNISKLKITMLHHNVHFAKYERKWPTTVSILIKDLLCNLPFIKYILRFTPFHLKYLHHFKKIAYITLETNSRCKNIASIIEQSTITPFSFLLFFSFPEIWIENVNYHFYIYPVHRIAPISHTPACKSW